ncbi:hypothetical protein [uncultured Piscinibacter sp.]|uniref:hypothetical protein n=1 Tax=uncultured Piscinibacter sp. TaxID=1131835 RepID=UPI0026381AEB|nr:hypothetical protein [uncultured Piscinibacter sp.]
MNRRHVWIALACAALMSACGGGDDDSGTSPFVPPTSDFNPLVGWQNLLGTGGTWTVSGTGSDNLAYSATLSYAPSTPAVFPVTDTSHDRSILTSTLTQDGVSLGSGTVEFFRSSDFRLEAVRVTPANGAALCSLATASALPPGAAKVFASGALASLNDLNGCLPASLPVGTTESTWTIDFERGIVLLCLSSVSRDATLQVIGRESDCFQMAEDGTLGTRARVSIVQPGFTLVMKNF